MDSISMPGYHGALEIGYNSMAAVKWFVDMAGRTDGIFKRYFPVLSRCSAALWCCGYLAKLHYNNSLVLGTRRISVSGGYGNNRIPRPDGATGPD